jgi:hypothetical protein
MLWDCNLLILLTRTNQSALALIHYLPFLQVPYNSNFFFNLLFYHLFLLTLLCTFAELRSFGGWTCNKTITACVLYLSQSLKQVFKQSLWQFCMSIRFMIINLSSQSFCKNLLMVIYWCVQTLCRVLYVCFISCDNVVSGAPMESCKLVISASFCKETVWTLPFPCPWWRSDKI